MAIGIDENWSLPKEDTTKVFIIFDDKEIVGIFSPNVYNNEIKHKIENFSYTVKEYKLNCRSFKSGL